MIPSTKKQTLTVALIGNPNTGKSTLFNAVVGVRQRVGNYPGVTVEKKIGRLNLGDQAIDLIDLPGTYSLAPRSPDEMVAVDVLLGRKGQTPPDAVICIVDAGNLQRNLYLVSQVLELGLPTVVVLNMIDVADSNGIKIDHDRLGRQLGVAVVRTQANRSVGLDQLTAALSTALGNKPHSVESPFPEAFTAEVDSLAAVLASEHRQPLPRYLVERLLLDTSGYLQHDILSDDDHPIGKRLDDARDRLGQAGCTVPAVEAVARYGWVGKILDGVVTGPSRITRSRTDEIDRVLTHWLFGVVIFATMMLLVFQAVFSWAVPLMNLIEAAKGWAGGWVQGMMAEGALRSLLVSGVIEGVGGVLVFLPQILILFFFIAVLEDCGYMARAAYLMDKLMVCVGLSGKSFIPLLSSFACAVPGVMAARVIENRRDRLVTILVAPLMSCSARLPVYTLLIAAFIPKRSLFPDGPSWISVLGVQGATMFAMYLVGIATAVAVALLLKKTILKGETPPFVMELPGYKFPSLTTVFFRVADRGWAFVRRAGTLIFAVTIIVWASAYYPRNLDLVDAGLTTQQAKLRRKLHQLETNKSVDPSQRQLLQRELTLVENKIDGQLLRQSYLGRAGAVIEPAVRPIGWDWRVGCAVIASFPAREVVVGTMGVLYDLGGDQDEASEKLRDKLKAATWDGSDEKVFNIPVALSLMVFFALCAQCAATLAVIKRETNSWRWPIFSFTYMTTLAYFGALVTYRLGMMFVS